MGTTRNILRALGSGLESFVKEFGFYLDSLDRIFSLQERIGLEEDALAALPEVSQRIVKSYVFLNESVNTTSMGALRLFAGNLYSDTFALLRMVYEVSSLMHYGNQSSRQAEEVYATMFSSGLNEEAHAKGEWKLIQKAEKSCEKMTPQLLDIRKYINNFGVHVSRAKIVLGNVTVFGSQSASTVFSDNSRKGEYVMGLDMLHCLLMMVLGQYDKQMVSHPGALASVADEISEHERQFLAEIRPELKKRVETRNR